jgi:hypothetical protein
MWQLIIEKSLLIFSIDGGSQPALFFLLCPLLRLLEIDVDGGVRSK